MGWEEEGVGKEERSKVISGFRTYKNQRIRSAEPYLFKPTLQSDVRAP